jgi:hypothetical protein
MRVAVGMAEPLAPVAEEDVEKVVMIVKLTP